MKTITFYLLFLFPVYSVFSQTVADSLVRDSVPILLTDTTSYNTHARIMVYSSSGSIYEDNSSVYLLFYDKQPDTATYSSIWCRELKTMTPETVFLQSNDSVRYSNPQATNSGVIFYEERRDSTVTVKGLLIDPLTMTGLDTVTVFTTQAPVKMVANSMYVFWLKDSILFRQEFSINSNIISLNALDTLSTHATDVCVADYIDNFGYYFYGDFAFLSYGNSQFYLFKGDNYSIGILDSGLISGIHFNYSNNYLFYKKDSKEVCYSSSWGQFTPIVLFGNDTVVPEYAVADNGIMGSKVYGTVRRMAFVPDSFPNVFNYCATDNNNFMASDTFYFPDDYNYWEDFYAYPFPANDTVKNLIMHRGFIFFQNYETYTWDLKIVFEVKHNNGNALYLVRSSVSDVGGNIFTQIGRAHV